MKEKYFKCPQSQREISSVGHSGYPVILLRWEASENKDMGLIESANGILNKV
jgi:hypothetical protein